MSLAAFALLAVAVIVHVYLPAAGPWPLAGAFAFLAANLAAALAVHPLIRRGGLGVFHFALLVALVMAGAGRLTHLEARVEVVEGSAFDPEAAIVQSRGPLYPGSIADVAFVQGPFSIEYRPFLKRGRTTSLVYVAAEDGAAAQPRRVGDDEPLVARGHRFYTTSNKGFAAVLTWVPRRGEAVTGAVHMPSFPILEWKQVQQWHAPAGPVFELELKPAVAADSAGHWRLQPGDAGGTLRVSAGATTRTLAAGEVLEVATGTLRFEGVRGWMGYVVYFDPMLRPMLVVAIVGLLGLAAHVGGRLLSRRGAATASGFADGRSDARPTANAAGAGAAAGAGESVGA